MNKTEALKLALESWSFSDKQTIPDYLYDKIGPSLGVLEKELLK